MKGEKLFTKKVAKMTGTQLVIYIPKPLTELVHAGELVTTYKQNSTEALFTKKISKVSSGKLAIYVPKPLTGLVNAKDLISVYKTQATQPEAISPKTSTPKTTVEPPQANTPPPTTPKEERIERGQLKCVEGNHEFEISLHDPSLHKALIYKNHDIKLAIHEAAEKGLEITIIPKYKSISVSKHAFNREKYANGEYPWDLSHVKDVHPIKILKKLGFESTSNDVIKTKNYELFSKTHKIAHKDEQEYLKITPTIIIANQKLFVTENLDEVLHIE